MNHDHLQKIALGDWTVFPLSDGYLDLDQKMFSGITSEALRQQLSQAQVHCVEDLTVRTEVHGYLIDTGEKVILIDAGCGQKYGIAAGRLINNLHQLGYVPEDISLVLITHLHPDHIGGLIKSDGSPAFQNATICISDSEASYWLGSNYESMSDNDRFVFCLAREVFAPYERSQKLRLIHSGELITQGITAIQAYGHSPGHMAFLCHSQNQKLLLWGDVVHTAGIQFSDPDLYIIYDSNGEQAVNTRKQLFAIAADQHLLVGGGHLPFSGMGYVYRAGKVFSWEPLEQHLYLSTTLVHGR
jgi:glyoxylase-like metal-dependent hydrolase (beta-lactamase superfamily II)